VLKQNVSPGPEQEGKIFIDGQRLYGTETYLKSVDADGSNATTVLSKTVPPKGTSLQLMAWR
jgi:hypothetical protein